MKNVETMHLYEELEKSKKKYNQFEEKSAEVIEV